MPSPFKGAVAEFVRKNYGGDFYVRENVVNVTPSAVVEALGNNGDRVFAAIINLSTNTGFLAYDNQVSSSRGMELGVSGGSYSVNLLEDLILPTLSHFLAVSAGTSDFYTLEVIRLNVVVEESDAA